MACNGTQRVAVNFHYDIVNPIRTKQRRVEMNDCCPTKTVTVIVQENEIVRPLDCQGILGRFNQGTFKDLIDESGDNKIANAMDVIKQAMIDDKPSEPGSYAHSWHCNVAMMCYDAIHAADIVDENCMDEIHAVSNDAASRFMKICFDVETKA